MTSVPATLDDLTTAWLSRALAPRHGPVATFTVERIGADTGYASEMGRVTPTYEGHAAGPKNLVVKLAAGRREAAFYRDIGSYAGVRVPHCHAAAYDEATDRAALVLEDIGAASFGDAATGCSVADAELVVDALAQLHARWWQSPRLSSVRPFPEPPLDTLAVRLAAVRERHGPLVPEAVLSLTDRIRPRHVRLFAPLAGPPATLLHVDCHLDNIAFLDGEVVLFDWSGAAGGVGAFDLAHFLSSALRGGDWAALPDLVGRYHRGLVAGGVAGYSHDELDRHHRLAVLRLWLGVVGGAGSPAAADWPDRLAAVMGEALARVSGYVAAVGAGALVDGG